MDGHGYDCFWAGHRKLWRITGCFDDAWDGKAKAWSNVACALRVDACWQASLAPFVHEYTQAAYDKEKQQMVAAELQAEKFARKIKKGVAKMEEEQKKQKKTAAVADKHKKARPRVTAAVHDG